MEVSLSVEVKVGNVIAKLIKPSIGIFIAGRVRRSHVRWKVSQDVGESNLIVDHLVPELGPAQRREALMRPCMTGDLVAVSDHSSNESRPCCVWVVDSSFAEVPSSDVEGRFRVVFLDMLEADGLWEGHSPGGDRGDLLCT